MEGALFERGKFIWEGSFILEVEFKHSKEEMVSIFLGGTGDEGLGLPSLEPIYGPGAIPGARGIPALPPRRT